MSTGTHPPARGAAARPAAPAGAVPVRATPERPVLPAGHGQVAPSRVSILAPRTRIDVALPADVPLADLLPTLLDLAGETARGSTGHHDPAGDDDHADPTGWTLAPLGQAPAASDRTLASLGVLDGDQLVLRRRADAAPPPLFDDVVEAVAEATPASFRAWSPAWARRLGVVGLAPGPVLAAAALVAAGRGAGTAGGVATAVVAGVLAVGCLALGAVCARVVDQPAAGAVLAGGGALLAAVCGLAAVPTTGGAGPLTAGMAAPHLLLAAVLAAVVSGLALLALGTASRSGLAALVAVLLAAALSAVVTAVAVVLDASGPGAAAALAAGAGAVAMVALALLPRTTIALARLPLPQVPASAEELADDPGVVEQAVLERRADRAHAAMNGLVAGCGVVVVGAVAVLAALPAPGLRGPAGTALAVLLVALLALRARTYANGLAAAVLLVAAVLGGLAVGVGAITTTDSRVALLVVVPLVALAAAAGALVLGVATPGRRFSPVARRAVDVLEAVGVAAVIPVALAVMDLYSVVRLW